MTKTLLAAVTFVVAFASPVFAQSFDPDIGSGNIVPPSAAYSPGYGGGSLVQRYGSPAWAGAFGAYAQEPAWNGLPQGPVVPTPTTPRRAPVRR
jgi:hypothetical protein